MMDLSFWRRWCWNYRFSTGVSILVMMDLSFWLTAPEYCSTQLLVSILVMMDLSFWPCQVYTLQVCTKVSILVMMDLSFWQCFCSGCFSAALFQSLLWWICHFDLKQYKQREREIGFQSLLWWICHFDWSFTRFDITSISSFQSLLWWICHFDRVLHQSKCTRTKVSILVMMDLSFWRAVFTVLDDTMDVSILVMMDLSFWLYCICKYFICSIVGFNPCYDGFVILTT